MSKTPISNYLIDINNQRNLLVDKLYKGTALTKQEYSDYNSSPRSNVLPLSEYVNRVPNIYDFIRKTATSIVTPSDITKLPTCAYEGFTNVKELTITNNITELKNNIIDNCNIETLNIDMTNIPTHLQSNSFYNHPTIESLNVGNNVRTIGQESFRHCKNLTSITIPDSVVSIGNFAFASTAYYNNEDNWDDNTLYIGNHLIKANNTISGQYTIKSGTKTIADGALINCKNLTSVSFPKTIVTIGDSAFAYCSSLTSITIPDSVINLGANVVTGCSELTELYIGETINMKLNYIEDLTIENCSKLTTIYITAKPANGIHPEAIYDCKNLKTIYVPWSEGEVAGAPWGAPDDVTIYYNTLMPEDGW